MRPFLPFAAVLTAAFLLGCQDQGSEPVGPDVLGVPFEPQFDKKGTPGDPCPEVEGGSRDDKGHCHGDGDGDGNDNEMTVALDHALSAVAQPATFKSNPNLIQGGAPNDCGTFGCFDNELNLSALTGTSVSGKGTIKNTFVLTGLGNCTTDPANMEAAFPEVLARLIDRLDDDAQLRKFYTRIDLQSVRAVTPSKVHRITQFWIDDDGSLFYRTSLGTHSLWPDENVLVEETTVDDPNVSNVFKFKFSGGSWRSWEPDTPLPGAPHGAVLVCKNIGEVTMTIKNL